MIGNKIKRLTVVELISGTKSRNRLWLCKCECGNLISKSESALKSERFSGCNCNIFIGEIGKKYNYIFVKDFNIKTKKYICICDCGKELSKYKFELKQMISCGCKKSKDLTNLVRGRLTFIKKTERGWECKCECGNITYNPDSRTRSCGCLIKEVGKINIQKAIKSVVDKSDGLANIRKQFKKVYGDGNLSFEDFLKLSKQNCYYCGAEPNNIKRKSSKSTEDYIYNGLDRINNLDRHNLDNVVPCCWFCNRSKSYYSVDSFKEWASKIKPREKIEPNYVDIKDFNILKRHFKLVYSDGDLTFQDFVNYSQMDCYYCGVEPNNKKKNIYWHGIDRINNNLGHIKTNIVTCCKRCNFAKSNLSLEEFYNRVKLINCYNSCL